MDAAKTKYRFESEIHLGLLSIIFVLLLLSGTSNYFLFRARTELGDRVSEQLRSAATAVIRLAQETEGSGLSAEQRLQVMRELRLSGLIMAPAAPSDSGAAARANWLGRTLRQLPASQAPSVVEKLLLGEKHKLTRGKAHEFFMVTPVPGKQPRVAIVSMNHPVLAYLEDSSRVILWAGGVLIILAAAGYFAVSRTIFKPFRKIKEQAARSGRSLAGVEHEADAVVEEYRQVIEDLRTHQAELVRLNATIQNRADSLEQYNQYLLDSVETGVVSLDLPGNIRALNGAAERILQRSPEIVGKPYSVVFGVDSQIGAMIRSVTAGGCPPGYREINYHTSAGAQLTLGAIVSAVRDQTGQAVGISLLITDLTEVTTLRAQVEQATRLAALGEMAAGLAHQIRNSMGAIGGFGNLAKRRLAGAGQPSEQIEALLAEAREAEELVTKFLAFARPLNPQAETVDLAGLVQALIDGYRARDECRSVQFRCTCEDVRIWADPLLLKQALGNLVDNAILAYEGRSGRIDVTVTESNGEVVIEVIDHGSGIPLEIQQRIFTPFYSTRPSGSGLGLPLASRIAELHGGNIRIDSAPGHGTTVAVILPVAPAVVAGC